MSVEEYLALPEEKPYLEYVNGEVYEKPMGDWTHSDTVRALLRILELYASWAGGNPATEGRVGFDDPGEVRFYLPDAAFYRKGVDRRRRPMPPPTLTIEVRSPGQALAKLREKVAYFRAHGSDEAWIVDPEARSIEVHDASREGDVVRGSDVLASSSLPGLEVDLPALFAVLDEE